MDKNTGFVKIYRSITKWGWYQDANTARVFFHCILMANFEDREWRGIKIPRGTFVTSIGNMARELKLTKKQIRTAIEHLIMSHEIAYKGTRRNSVITVNNYNRFQQKGTPAETLKEHRSNTEGTLRDTTKEYKERKKGRREEYYDLDKFFENLMEEARKEGKL